jgi:outer membrane usher protein
MGGYGNYRSPFGRFSANASIGNTLRQAALNAEGALIAHKGGVTFGPALGSAAALIEAKGAQGGRVINGQGATIDRNGYAVIPMLMPYRINRVAIDPSDLPEDVELLNTSEDIVPNHNSLVLVKMPTVHGTPILATVQDAAGRSMPLGTGIFDISGKSLGEVGQGGMTFLRGLEGNGILVAKWGGMPDERCDMPYSIPSAIPGTTDASALVRVTLRCAPPKQQ